jgi:endonuclease/exonuclease/phosphatase family metal-dependent hydrolase
MNFRKYNKGILMVITSVLSIGFSFSQEQETAKVRIMTYNIWNGFDWGNDATRKANCINLIKSKKPDILALQELCGYDEQQLKEDALSWGHQYVQILKTEGYPTALTSNKPIQVKERAIESFWHGLLHCETYGIDFFVVHLSPSDSDIRLDEARQITKKIKELNNDFYIILGDFNAQSPIDASWVEKNQDLKAKYTPTKKEKHANLRLGEFDYAVISEFLACPSVDVCLGKINLQEGYTFPTPALLGKYNNTSQTIVQNRVRIDYILASPALAKYCREATIFNQKETHMLSDHYPILAEFIIKKE